jgi:hypothetical protein
VLGGRERWAGGPTRGGRPDRSRTRLALVAAAGGLVLAGAACGSDSSATPVDPAARSQSWTNVPGACSDVDGAVFTISSEGCGGPGGAFDDTQIYIPAVLVDQARPDAPCPGIEDGDTCYRMWYVGNDEDEVRRIGYATSPDGVEWTRVPGGASDGSILEPGAEGAFDSDGASAPTVILDGDVFKMWYTGIGPDESIQGVGLATSTDGITWQKVPGPAEGGAVLRESDESGTFDRSQVITSVVLKDVATAEVPCSGVAAGSPCYKMWYEGVDTSDGYIYRVGYATSPDGVAWTKVPGADPTNAVLGLGAKGAFDDAGVGVPNVIKDGALYRMWYEAFGNPTYVIGYASSPDGVTWTRADDLAPALRGADDPAGYDPDDVWTATVAREGSSYRMWYTVSSKPESRRFGLAHLQPGAELTDVAVDADGLLTFTTTEPIPAGGSVLVVGLGLEIEGIGTAEGFGAAEAVLDASAVTDGVARGVARPAVLIRATEEIPAGPKSIALELGSVGAGDTGGTAAPALVVQTFDTVDTLEFGEATVTA